MFEVLCRPVCSPGPGKPEPMPPCKKGRSGSGFFCSDHRKGGNWKQPDAALSVAAACAVS